MNCSEFDREFKPKKINENSLFALEKISILSFAYIWHKPLEDKLFLDKLDLKFDTIFGIILQNARVFFEYSSEIDSNLWISYKSWKTSLSSAIPISISLISFNNVFAQFLKRL